MLGAQGIIPARGRRRHRRRASTRIAGELGDGRLRLPPRRRGHPHRRRAPPDRAGRRRRPPPPHRPQPQRPGHHRHAAATCASAARPSAGCCAALAEALLARPRPTSTRCCPGYTHGQRAQPVRLAHHLLAYVWMLGRDRARLGHVIAAHRRVPARLGRARRASGFPIDRGRGRRGPRLRPRPDPQQPRRRRQPRRPGRLPPLRRPARRAPLAPRRRDRALGRRGGRLRRARRRLHLGLVDAAAEEEPRRRRARARQGAAPDRRPVRACSASCPACRWPTTRTCRRTRRTCSTPSTPSTCSCPR